MIEKDPVTLSTGPGQHVIGQLAGLSPEQRSRLFNGAAAALNSGVQPVLRASESLLDQMIKGDMLTQAERDRIIELALEHQKTGKSLAGKWLMDRLEVAELKGKFTPEQQERFRRQAHDVTDFAVRKTVIVGDAVPYQHTIGGRGPDDHLGTGQPSWWTGYKMTRVLVDGKGISSGTYSSHGSGFGINTSGSTVHFNQPGRHKLEVELELSVYYGQRKGVNEDPAKLRWKRNRVVTGEFEVLPAAPPSHMKWVTDPPPEAMRKLVFPREASRRSYQGGQGIGVTLAVNNPPVNLGFHVFGRIGGVEHPIGSVVIPAGTTTAQRFSTHKFPPTPSGKLEVILRSSEKVVRETVSMYEAWKGEMVFENVPIND
jgi:hypothetical protein